MIKNNRPLGKVDLSIITVGYFSQSTLVALLKSISLQVDCTIEFIYVENSPQSSAISTVQKHYPSAIIVEPDENLGFSRGCNRGASLAQGEYLLFLNPDCEIYTEDTLKNMLNFLRERPDVGICGPQFINAKKHRIQGAHRDYFGAEFIPNAFKDLPGRVAWVSGAALMISNALYKKINGFDERYFIHCDDIDICLTVRKLGYTIAEVPQTRILHVGGASFDQVFNKKQSLKILHQAYIIFTEKNYLPREQTIIWKKYRNKYLLKVLKYLYHPQKAFKFWIRFSLANSAMLEFKHDNY